MVIKIIVDADFGSNFQEEIAVESLSAMVTVWKDAVKSRHNKNRAEVTFEVDRTKEARTAQEIDRQLREGKSNG